mmetsp:Transcript_14412/g.50106  ORF Transcript_14412/g.50106 Transcript_14412/m.50106 type:complete len:448 (-) Transcript_14412:68-1411(-)
MGAIQSMLDRPRDGVYMKKVRKLVTYQTVKLVQIDDLFLGGLHYVFLLLVFLWIAVYNVAYQNAYIRFESPIGSVRTSLQGPTQVSPKTGSPCDPTKPVPACSYEFTDPSLLQYCSQSGAVVYGEGQLTLPCVNWDAEDVISPVTGSEVLYIGTRVQESNATLQCQFPPRGGKPCPQTYETACHRSFTVDPSCSQADTAVENYFVADIERYTVLLDHSVRSPTNPHVHGDSSSMSGSLMSCNGTIVTPDKTPNGQDILSIGQLLNGASFGEQCGVSLDDVSSVYGSSNTSRYDGIVLVVAIEYSNVERWTGMQSNISYVYKSSVLVGTKSKVARQIFVDYPDKRVVRDMHGIKLVAEQSGQLGQFDATTLLLQLAASTALLAVATAVVDQLAIRVLPWRKAYRNAKFDEIEVPEGAEGDAIVPLLRNPMRHSMSSRFLLDGQRDDSE